MCGCGLRVNTASGVRGLGVEKVVVLEVRIGVATRTRGAGDKDFQPKSRQALLIAHRSKAPMPLTFGLRLHSTPDTDGNAPMGAVRRVRDIVGLVQPKYLSFVSSAAAPPRPGKKRIEIQTPERSKVATTINYYRDQHGRLSKQALMEVKKECVKAGVLCSLAFIEKIGMRRNTQRKTGVPMAGISVRTPPPTPFAHALLCLSLLILARCCC